MKIRIIKEFLLIIFLVTFIPLFKCCIKDRDAHAFGDGIVFSDDLQDIDGNIYKTVKIGNQVWMAENLKTTRFSDGELIPTANTGSKNAFPIDAKEYYFYGDRDIYGALYSWLAATNGEGSSNTNPSGLQGVCPTGWHLPSDAEWGELESFLGAQAGGKLKERGTDHWLSPNTGATDEYGFCARPGGTYMGPTYPSYPGFFGLMGKMAVFWTSTQDPSYWGSLVTVCRKIGYESPDIKTEKGGLASSVRCVKNIDGNERPRVSTGKIRYIADNTAIITGTVSSAGNSNLKDYGVCWGTDSSNLLIETADHGSADSITNNHFVSILNNLVPGKKYYARAFAANNSGTGYGNTISFNTRILKQSLNFNPAVEYGELTDQDGNKYKTITIGSQTWMAENLKAITFNDGRPLDYISADDSIYPSFTWYNNDIVLSKPDFGVLYNDLFAIRNSARLCPAGWRIPSIDDWDILINFLGGYDSAGGKLKEQGTTHWNEPNNAATNESGFTAIPAGRGSRTYSNYNFRDFGLSSYFPSSEIVISREAGVDLTRGRQVVFTFNSGIISKTFGYTDYFYSVRCIKK